MVPRVEWANPHMYLLHVGQEQRRKACELDMPGTGLNALGRRGWTRDLVKVGDTMTLIACPARGDAPVA